MHLSGWGVDACRMVVPFDILIPYYKETFFGRQLYGWGIASDGRNRVARPLTRGIATCAMWVALLRPLVP